MFVCALIGVRLRADNGAMQAIETAADRIRQHPSFLQIDLSGCGMAEVLALCAQFAGLCATARTRGAMVKGGDEEVQRCMVVRDLIRIMLLVAPRGFRLALVPGTPRTAAVYRKSEAELRAAGLDARFFESEALAARWLGALSAASSRLGGPCPD